MMAALGAAAPAFAQQPQAAPQPQAPVTIGGLFGGRRPPDPNNPDRSSQQLTLQTDFLGGYDGQQGGQQVSSEFTQAGTIASTAAELRHRWGTSKNFLDSFARGNLTLARLGIEQQTTGASQVHGAVALGKRARFDVQVDGVYQPTYLFNAFGAPSDFGAEAVMPEGTPPATELTHGFTEERWLQTSASPRLQRNWTPRQVSELHYTASRRTLMRATDNYSTSNAAGFRHDWSYRERAGLLLSYQWEEYRQRGNDVNEQPVQSHHATIGARVTKRWPKSRTMTLSAGAGATKSERLETETSPAFDFIVPTMTVGIQTQLSPAWAWSIDGSRNVTILEGLTPLPFVTDIAAVSLRGRIGIAELQSTGAFSHGAAHEGSTGEFQTAIGNVDVYFPVGRRFSFSTSYNFYDHRLLDLSELQAHLPAQTRRHSVRVGARIWLPLFGTF